VDEDDAEICKNTLSSSAAIIPRFISFHVRINDSRVKIDHLSHCALSIHDVYDVIVRKAPASNYSCNQCIWHNAKCAIEKLPDLGIGMTEGGIA
jgi:hypothetical protein